MPDASDKIRIGIIGGTGLAEALGHDDVGLQNVESHEIDTPFGRPSAPITTGELSGAPVALLARHGVGHVLNPAAVPARANIFALKTLECTHIIASGATGSLREEIAPGDLVICDQLIDKTNGRPKTFYEHAAVHVEFAEPFCPVMRRWLLAVDSANPGVKMHDRGTYICMEGPSFSSRAESHMHRQWGGDLIGMTALPEARLAREAEMAYALIALPTDYDCWRQRDDGSDPSDPHSLLEEIMGNLRRATEASINLIQAALGDVSMLRDTPSPAHGALRLAIWSDKTQIDAGEIERLRPLWGRHFE